MFDARGLGGGDKKHEEFLQMNKSLGLCVIRTRVINDLRRVVEKSEEEDDNPDEFPNRGF